MIFLIANIKGGVGKSTIATNLAALRAQHFEKKPKKGKKSILLIDADEQGSSSTWANLRQKTTNQPKVYFQKSTDEQIEGVILQNNNDFEDLIIDAGGVDTDAVRYALLHANRLLIPIIPGPFDIWAFEKFLKILIEADKTRKQRETQPLMTAVLLNKKPSQVHSKLFNAILDYLEEQKEKIAVNILDTTIGLRTVFGLCANEGLALNEFKPTNKKANKEITDLHNEIWD